jgi:hypothetical protein
LALAADAARPEGGDLAVAGQLRSPRGPPFAEMARRVGQRKLSVTLDTYSHVVLDRREIDGAAFL